MKDMKGILRTFCTACGIDECDEFITRDADFFCAYCGCSPVKHMKQETTDSTSLIQISAIAGSEKLQHQLVDPEHGNSPMKLEETTYSTSQIQISAIAGSEKLQHQLVDPEHGNSPMKYTEHNTPDLGIDHLEPLTAYQPSTSAYTAANTIKDLNKKAQIKKLEFIMPELPKFSKSVEEALLNDTVKDKLWGNFIMQCSSYYVHVPEMMTKTAYELVGRTMFERYPSIESVGPKPWTLFTKTLSQKMRKDRLKMKGMSDSFQKKGFETLKTKKESEDLNNQPENVRTGLVFQRTQASVSSYITEDVPSVKKKIIEEWAKPWPEKALVKVYLRETFVDRTDLIKKNVPFGDFLKEYPCFIHAEYLIYEFSMLLGTNAFAEMRAQMKLFFVKISMMHNKHHDVLFDWLWFEKQCAVTNNKVKSKPIIEITRDSTEYKDRLHSISPYESPAGLVLLMDNKIIDCAVIYSGNFLEIKAADCMNVQHIILILISAYYAFELNYPRPYIQAMGVFGHFVLRHNYYKLGVKATKFLTKLQ